MPHSDREARNKYMRDRRKSHPEKVKAREAKYREANRDKIRENAARRKSDPKTKRHDLENTKQRRRDVRAQAISRYGGKCACCGEQGYGFLTIDHVNNDGNIHRKSVTNAYLPWWLKKNNYPAGFQVLCYNCNCSKRVYGVCFHATAESKPAQE